MNQQKLFIAIPSLLAMLCTFLPWVREYGHMYSGRQLDGWITLVLFGTSLVICMGGNLQDPLEKKFKLGIFGTSGLATIIGLSKIIKASPFIQQILPDALSSSFAYGWEIQFGLYLMVSLGILIITLTAFLKFNKENRPEF